MEQWGPVSQALADEVAREARQRGVIVWLDKEGDYTAFTDGLAARHAAGRFSVPVVGWRGSHLEVMLAAEKLAGGVDPTPLVVHAPGFSEQSVRATPLLELYEAGKVYRRALATLVTEAAAGVVRPDALATFLGQGALTLASADAWLSGWQSGGEGGLVGRLRGMTDEAILDDLLRPTSPLAVEVARPEGRQAVLGHEAVRLGLPDGWASTLGLPPPASAGDVAFLVGAWALCVEYVHDLRRAPFVSWLVPLRALPKPVVAACTAVAGHLRLRHEEHTARIAAEVEALLDVEVERGSAEDLGEIDTFRFEEERILVAALDAIERVDFAAAAKWAAQRRAGDSFWLRRDPERVAAWELVACGAALGLAIDGARGVLAGAHDVGLAAAAYVARGAVVDRAHRHLLQRRAALWHTRLPEMPALRVQLDRLDGMHQGWALDLANTFSDVCRRAGALPDASLQQRALFDEVVRPLAAQGLTAYFLVDALRYEMAEELARAFAGPATQVTLRHRLAELPTESAVGMNALAPVSRGGRLRVVLRDGRIAGFASAEFQVITPDDRRRAILEAVGGESCPWLALDQVLDRDATALRNTLTKARVVVVHSLEIDAFGHKGAGPGMFDTVLQRLRAAWRLLHEAGVRRFVITADHGFLLIDRPTALLQQHGTVDPKRRYVVSDVPADNDGEVRIPMADLRYDGAALQVIFPRGTTLFDTKQPAPSFVHGGNSLQERVIPVLTVVHRSGAGGDAEAFTLSAERVPGALGAHAVRVSAKAAQHGLDFGRPKDVEIGLRVADRDVTVIVAEAREGARRDGAGLRLTVGVAGEVVFRLQAPSERHVQVEVVVIGARAEPVVAPGWFEATVPQGSKSSESAGQASVESNGDAPDALGLGALPEGVREVFAHLAKYGTIGEGEVATLLGSAREARKFARSFEEHAALVRFEVRIESVGGVKQYVRRGASS